MSVNDNFVSYNEETLAPYKVLGWSMFVPAVFFITLAVLLVGGSAVFTIINFFSDVCWDPQGIGVCLDPFQDGLKIIILKPFFITIMFLGVFLSVLSFSFLNKGYAKSKINGNKLKKVFFATILITIIIYIAIG